MASRPVARTSAGWLISGAVLAGDNPFGVHQRGRTQVGVADGVHHHRVRRHNITHIEEIGIHGRYGEDLIVDPMLCRDIAAHGGDQQHKRDASPHAAIAPPDHRVSAEALPPMFIGIFAQIGQHPGKALMRLWQIRVDRKCGLVMLPRSGGIAGLGQQAGMSDMRHLVAGMAPHRLTIGFACGGQVSAGMGQCSKFQKRVAIFRIDPQTIEVDLFCRLVIALRHESTGVVQYGDAHVGHCYRRPV